MGAAGSIAEIIQRWKGSGGGKREYIVNCRRAKKLIPVEENPQSIKMRLI